MTKVKAVIRKRPRWDGDPHPWMVRTYGIVSPDVLFPLSGQRAPTWSMVCEFAAWSIQRGVPWDV